MRKGIVRIILGLTLILFQSMSVIGNCMNGVDNFSPPISSGQLMFDLVFYLSYYFVGIVGLLLFASGLIAFFNIDLFHLKAKSTNIIKRRFCRYCGNAIDPITKKCTGCGKQYFKMPVLKKGNLVPKVVVILSVLIVGMCVYRNIQYQNQIAQLNTQITELNEALKTLQSELETAKSDVSEIQDKYRAKFSEAYDLAQENKKLKASYSICEDHVVVVMDDDKDTYHKCDCILVHLGYSAYTVYAKSEVKDRGMSPCFMCVN